MNAGLLLVMETDNYYYILLASNTDQESIYSILNSLVVDGLLRGKNSHVPKAMEIMGVAPELILF